MMRPSQLLFADMTREELGAIASETMVVIPVGATEQHGPHLPTGTDYYTVEHLCQEAARKASAEVPVIVTPALPFGSSDHHFIFGGTLSFSTETYYRVMKELVLSLVKDGFQRAFIVNGHGGNHEIIQLAARDVALHHPMRCAAGSYWVIAWDALIEAGAHHGCRLPGHAGIFETSMMLATRPGLVRTERPHRDGEFETDARGFHSAYRHEKHGFWKSIDGFTDSPDQGNAVFGEKCQNAIIGALAKAFIDFYRAE